MCIRTFCFTSISLFCICYFAYIYQYYSSVLRRESRQEDCFFGHPACCKKPGSSRQLARPRPDVLYTLGLEFEGFSAGFRVRG